MLQVGEKFGRFLSPWIRYQDNLHILVYTMLANIQRLLTRHKPLSSHQLFGKAASRSQKLSIISTHSSFPATLYRFQPQRRSALLDVSERAKEESTADGVIVSKDGLVYPGVAANLTCLSYADYIFTNAFALIRHCTATNGARFMPNTFLMQELMRMHLDYYLEDLENGSKVEEPSCICVEKGLAILAS